MEAHHRLEILARVRRVEHHAAAEAVSDRGHLPGIDVRILGEQLTRGVEASHHGGGILRRLRHEGLGLGWVRGHLALAVHVERERRIAGLRQSPRLPPRVLVVPPPLVHHDHARALAGIRIVPRQITSKGRAALLVVHHAGLHGCHRG